ncbi:MAG: transglycosylase domain-containing protein [Actinomyces sp.]|uniref:transglycosylase domain-containing protein n=1 Tax=Actinomyces sp. TaxID=29317 RepID=UPI0026DC0A9D|nr:transglycosylase domain-containing protein [Actinomyces sp.]MDO4242818.1 transglycosylase domain-containing protein [Actinomyces sp.]
MGSSHPPVQRNEVRVAGSTGKGARPKGTKLSQAAGASRTPSKGLPASIPPAGRAGAAEPPAPAAATTAAGKASKTGKAERSAQAGSSEAVKAGKAGRKRRFLNYPRAGKGRVMRWLPSWRFVLGSFLLLILAAVGGFVLAYSMVKVPEPSEFAQAQTTTVYYSDGTTVMGEFAEIDRTIVDTTAVPDYVGNAVVASEDRTFYTNSGVDPKGIVRALVNNLRGGATQGASTLTQQYIKNYYVDTTSSYVGKFKQAIMAIKIDRELSKEEILDSYLNTVYYGRGAYGIEAAAQAYFGHSAAELTVSEAALIAGILPAPSSWDPAIDPAKAEERWGRVLDYMLEDGYITQEQYDSATFPETIASQNAETYAGTNGYLLQLVRAELESDAGLTAQQIDTGGYHIVTTIDQQNQEAAVAAVQNLPEGASPDLRVGLVSIDATTGGIVALYGGSDYLTNQVNSSTDAVAQAGSTYKPFALVAALEEGASLSDGYTSDSPMTIEGDQYVNFRGVSYGWSNLIKATQYSINTAYVQLNRDVGPDLTNDAAVRAGYPQDTIGMNDYVQNVLGSASPHTIDIATAYATFASQGTRHDTHIVHSVNNADGSVVYTGNTEGEKVFSDDVMADATYAMEQVVQYGSGETALALDRPVAAKTGSSTDNKSAQFAGYTPQIATAVTLYQTGADGSEESITPWGEYDEITGSTYPADIFTDYMAVALADLPVEEFPERTSASYGRGSLGEATPEPSYEPTQAPVEETQAPVEESPAPVETQSADQDRDQPTQGNGGTGGGGVDSGDGTDTQDQQSGSGNQNNAGGG